MWIYTGSEHFAVHWLVSLQWLGEDDPPSLHCSSSYFDLVWTKFFLWPSLVLVGQGKHLLQRQIMWVQRSRQRKFNTWSLILKCNQRDSFPTNPSSVAKARGREEVVKLWENRGWKKIWTVARSTKFHAPSHCPAYIVGVAVKQATSFGFKYFGRSWSTCLDIYHIDPTENSEFRIEKKNSNFNQQARSHTRQQVRTLSNLKIKLFCLDLSRLYWKENYPF